MMELVFKMMELALKSMDFAFNVAGLIAVVSRSDGTTS